MIQIVNLVQNQVLVPVAIMDIIYQELDVYNVMLVVKLVLIHLLIVKVVFYKNIYIKISALIHVLYFILI